VAQGKKWHFQCWKTDVREAWEETAELSDWKRTSENETSRMC